eukprot:2170129-Rhodomonas_salina.2
MPAGPAYAPAMPCPVLTPAALSAYAASWRCPVLTSPGIPLPDLHTPCLVLRRCFNKPLLNGLHVTSTESAFAMRSNGERRGNGVGRAGQRGASRYEGAAPYAMSGTRIAFDVVRIGYARRAVPIACNGAVLCAFAA